MKQHFDLMHVILCRLSNYWPEPWAPFCSGNHIMNCSFQTCWLSEDTELPCFRPKSEDIEIHMSLSSFFYFWLEWHATSISGTMLTAVKGLKFFEAHVSEIVHTAMAAQIFHWLPPPQIKACRFHSKNCCFVPFQQLRYALFPNDLIYSSKRFKSGVVCFKFRPNRFLHVLCLFESFVQPFTLWFECAQIKTHT